MIFLWNQNWVFRLIVLNGINRYTFITFDFPREMHVWAARNGVASAEKRYESPSFDQKKPLQEKLTPQRWVVFIFEAKSLKSNRIKYPIT